ncbi:MAG: hypothetical protein KBD01_09000 [Acidobacteria bacterium]|nr:hypothetical protein [Acidobacteriota bacterium]
MNYRGCAALLLFCVGVAGAEEQIQVGRSSHIRSEVLQEDRTVRIALPRSYDWALDRRYPVLYVLDAEVDFLHSASSARFLADAGEIPEMIVVGIDSTVRIRDFTQTDWAEVWVGGGGAARFKAFLAQELLPKIEAGYRTNGFRVLSGHSAGGQFALYCLTSDPSLFQAHFALSPSLDWDHNLPQRSLEEALASTATLKSFLYFAYSDDFGQALAEDQRLIHTLQIAAPRAFRWIGRAFPEESHGSLSLVAEIDALRCLFSGYRAPKDRPGSSIEQVEEHYRVLSKVVGYPIAVPEEAVNELGYAALSDGRTAEAIALFRRNVESSPSSANAWDSLADGYAKAGRPEEAVKASDRAVELATKLDHPERDPIVEHNKKLRAGTRAP